MKKKLEIEIKLAVRDPRAIKRKLKELGFRRAIARHFESNQLLDFPNLALRRAQSLLRLRSARGRSILTFKGAPGRSRQFKERPEVEAEIGDRKGLKAAIAGYGLRQIFRYDKYRTVYLPGPQAKAQSLEIAYDETPIGNFVELEGPRRAIDAVARGLGFARRDYITASYAALYEQWRRKRRLRPGNMVFAARKPEAKSLRGAERAE
ncbi:MAG TPA: class IV adenylate cyclase [Terriglobia bacterium]|nr:class IV adenylate cyclase [Terriglobia bacterium]